MSHLRRIIFAAVLVLAAYFGGKIIYRHLDPRTTICEEDIENDHWIATSKYWLDRQVCSRLGLCGLAHWRPDPATIPWTRKFEVKNYWQKDGIEEASQNILKEESQEGIPSLGSPIKSEDEDVDGDSSVLKDIPQYILDHAPLIHLYSGENFWPSDIAEHLKFTTPYLNYTKVNISTHQHTPYNLHEVEKVYNSSYLFTQSTDDVEERPVWLGSAHNKPLPYDDEEGGDWEEEKERKSTNLETATFSNGDGETWYDVSRLDPALTEVAFVNDSHSPSPEKVEMRRSRTRKSQHAETCSSITSTAFKLGGYSSAPSILVVVDKGLGIVDAFWFYFYSYNFGTTVFNIRFGNHIGDWEHSLIRFQDGVPKAVFFSAHSGGLAYAWKAVEKAKGREKRPILYSAVGSHAMYPTAGRHPYILPFGLLADLTDRGPLWDPALNYMAYHYNTSITHNVDARSSRDSTPTFNSTSLHPKLNASFQPASCNPSAPLGWWWYSGRWGDKFYRLRDWRQWRFFGQYHYVNGPFGPRFKNLGRAKVCQSGHVCRIVEDLTDGRSWVG
ncbi:BgTH12-03946 [Blumeria graminis f. sp. triticale]|uniref:Bgt-2691 n=4 Tax=Blumeria graminis TaxID=34373 RepID=A0A9X9L902_BLUGR|nr:BgTH12-03946 [Blumeria graminis f. sp. triticale]VCU40009.1 Bgt-2691 [Blumeria graminis f. sp. tritici]